MTNLKFFEEDPRGSEVPDPRSGQQPDEPHWRSLAEVKRAEYSETDVPNNGNRRRDSDPDNQGALSNDLETGRGGQR